MILMKLRPLSFDLPRRRWYFPVVYQHGPRRSQLPTMRPRWWDGNILVPSIGTYHRMYHRPNDGTYEASSSIFHRRFRRSICGEAAAMIVCASTSQPIEDWGECTIGGMGRDRKVLLLIVHLYLSNSHIVASLCTAWQGYNHPKEYDVNNLSKYKTKVSFLTLFYLYYSAIHY